MANTVFTLLCLIHGLSFSSFVASCKFLLYPNATVGSHRGVAAPTGVLNLPYIIERHRINQGVVSSSQRPAKHQCALDGCVMTKIPVPLHVDDVTVFSRALSKQLGDTSPSHLALMNMVSRAAGFQNLQHMRAVTAASHRMRNREPNSAPDARAVERTLNQFDEFGRLRQWPSRRSVQTLALWALWATLPSERLLSEKQVNSRLNAVHTFQDAATLRRSMISCGLMTRKNDGSDYRRLEQKPPSEAKAVVTCSPETSSL
jgi:hypothetical protein